MFTAIFYTICFVGCFWQVENISRLYFKYDTTTELSIDIPTELEAPDLSVCLRYVDVLDIARFSRDRNISVGSADGDGKYSVDHIQLVQETVTIADIFAYTPDVDDIFLSCLTRTPQSYEYIPANGKKCYELFTIINFYLQGNKC